MCRYACMCGCESVCRCVCVCVRACVCVSARTHVFVCLMFNGMESKVTQRAPSIMLYSNLHSKRRNIQAQTPFPLVLCHPLFVVMAHFNIKHHSSSSSIYIMYCLLPSPHFLKMTVTAQVSLVWPGTINTH